MDNEMRIACEFFFQYNNILFENYNKNMEVMRKRFQRRIKLKIERNLRIHQEFMRNSMEMFTQIAMKKKKRSVWMKKRSEDWWNSVFNSESFSEMYENFRMDKETFSFICEKLDPELKPNPQHIRASLCTEKKVAIAIFKLASCAEYRVVGNQFGVHKSTVKNCVYQFCDACIKILLKEEIKLPVGNELSNVMTAFENKTGLPQVLGAIDGTHIPILPKSEGHQDYINRKGWASLVLQAVVDSNYLFRDITCKHPGCTHDAVVFKDSYLYQNHNSLEMPRRIIDNKPIGAYLIGDPAYPLLPWLMKPYSLTQSPEEESLNVYFSKARIVVENAFGRLKGRWRILQKRIDINVDFVPRLVATCCILHNILERRRVQYNSSWNESVESSGTLFVQPSNRESLSNMEGEEIRDHIKTYMSNNFPLLQASHM